MISLIWAMDKNNLIGSNNKMPWHVKEDLLYFKEKTAGKTVLMGRSTYESLKGYYKNRPLPYGKIYVASTQIKELEDAIVIPDCKAFLENNQEDIFVIGGKKIYELALPYADYLYVSLIKGEFLGDCYFPFLDFSQYELIVNEEKEKVIFKVYKVNR